MSIRTRLITFYGSFFAVTIILFGLIVYGIFSRNLHDSLDTSLQNTARSLEASAVTVINQFTGERTIKIPLLDTFAAPSIFIDVLDKQGQSFIDLENQTMRKQLVNETVVNQALSGSPNLYDVPKSGAPVRVLATPFHYEGRIVGVTVVAQSLAEVQNGETQLALIMVLVGFGSLVTSLAILFLLTRRVLAPIARVTTTIQKIEVSQDLSQRVPGQRTQDEVGQLADTFNRMLDRLQLAFTFQQRFVADSSHELRTPLTVIRGNAALLHRLPNGPEREDALRSIESEAIRMSRIVDDLLLLAQLDAPTPRQRQDTDRLRRVVELDTLLLDAYKQAKVMAGNDLRVTLGHEDTASVIGDADQLRQLLLNLVSNAVKYTPEGGQITLSLYRDEQWAVIDVADSGIGISEADLPHIWERFYRVDKGRSRSAGGTGLGLPIVRSLAVAHGGGVAAYSRMGEGSVFRVWLPVIRNEAAASEGATPGMEQQLIRPSNEAVPAGNNNAPAETWARPGGVSGNEQ